MDKCKLKAIWNLLRAKEFFLVSDLGDDNLCTDYDCGHDFVCIVETEVDDVKWSEEWD